MKKYFQFIILVFFMMLINLLCHYIGEFFIEEYSNYLWGHFYFLDTLIIISIYSFFQIIIFPINKKYREFFIPLLNLLILSFFWFGDDFYGYGFEVAEGIASLTSKFVVLFSFIADYIPNDMIRINFIKSLYSFGYSLYLLIIFLTFKYIIKYFTKICIKYNFSIFLLKENNN